MSGDINSETANTTVTANIIINRFIAVPSFKSKAPLHHPATMAQGKAGSFFAQCRAPIIFPPLNITHYNLIIKSLFFQFEKLPPDIMEISLTPAWQSAKTC
jgi:hypothetical protein